MIERKRGQKKVRRRAKGSDRDNSGRMQMGYLWQQQCLFPISWPFVLARDRWIRQRSEDESKGFEDESKGFSKYPLWIETRILKH